jgi:cytoskeleton protein RodZ
MGYLTMGQITELPAKGNGLAMGVFGDRLRREREMRGISLDEICESTKIARRHLEALERERFDQLPGGVFNKGFVRAYEHFLGIDEDQAVADYSAATNEQPEPQDKFPLEVHKEPDRDLNPRTSYLPLIFALAALAGVLVGYFFWLRSKPAGDAPPPPTQQASPLPETKPQSSAPSVTPPETVNAAATAPAQPESPTASAAQAGRKPAEKTFAVVVRAKEDSWVSIIADGRSVMQKVLAADQRKLVKAGKQIVLRTGNAGGIDVTFNGRSMGALGNENEPRTLTFSAAGLVQ